MTALPELYFRVRDNGAAVFRLDTTNRDRRIEMEQIAVINTNRDDYKAQGNHILTEAEIIVITDWMARRVSVLAAREMDDIHRTIDHLNLTAQWAQAKASDTQLEEVSDGLLLAMHDLRAVLVRKKAGGLGKA